MADIEEPGQTPATATSRPLIISKGSIIKDPMVHAEENQPEPPAEIAPPSVNKKVIEPLAAPETETKVDEPKEPEVSPVETPDMDPEAELDPTDPKVNDKEFAEMEKRQTAVDTLVKSKKYFVPIGAVAKRKAGRQGVATIIILIIAVVAVVAAIDAELLAVNMDLPFDVIK